MTKRRRNGDSVACCTRSPSARHRMAAWRPASTGIVMLLCGEENLREVVLLPMNQRAEDLMMGERWKFRRSSSASCIFGW
jgi:hypothetical protein